jgi:hypothetical protein
MPHVCLVNCIHPPDDVRVVQKMGRFLSENGVRVSWVGPGEATEAPVENYGIKYHFYRRAQGRIGRLFAHQRQAFCVGLQIPRADVYVGVEPDSAVAAVRLARRHSAKAVFDVHEAYDDEMLRNWLPSPLRRPVGWCVRRALRRICQRCDLVMGVNDAVLAPYADIPTPRMIVRNCAPVAFADVPVADVFGRARVNITIMHGKATVAHGTTPVLQAMAIVRAEFPTARVIVFDCLDRGPHTMKRSDLDTLVASEHLGPGVDLRPMIPMKHMPSVLQGCDIGLIAYDRAFGVKSLPNKLFEYMAAGLPIIAPCYSAEIAPILRQEECGILADMENPRAVADAILTLARDPQRARAMGQRAREAFLIRHNYQAEAVRFLGTVRHWGSELASNGDAI